MIKIVGIGKAGQRVLSYLKNQKFHILEDIEIDFVHIANHEDYKALKYDEKDIIYTIAGLGGETGTKYVRLLTKEAKNLQVELKNILFLPFSYEGKGIGVNGVLEKLIAINPNIELFANDDLSIPKNRELDESELLRLYDKEIFEIINRKEPPKNSALIIEKTVHNTKYKALVYYSPKHYRVFLTFPKFKLIDHKSVGDDIPSTFGLIDKKHNITDLIDVHEIALKALDTYIIHTT